MQPLSTLPIAVRLGLTLLLLTVAGGLVAAINHLVDHHQNRDQRPGLSLEDLQAAYHGVRTTAPMIVALQRGHPDGLAAGDRQLLQQWLLGQNITENYDNLDLGDAAPAEVIDRSCVSCHSRQAASGGIGERLPLDYWDDVRKVAFSRDVPAVGVEILIASAHTHALSMGVLSIVLAGLAWLTRWPARLRSATILVCGTALFVDLAAWWIARSSVAFVAVLATAGTVWMASAAMLVAFVLLDLWLPARRG